jgi:KUP system potassium uptake protein
LVFTEAGSGHDAAVQLGYVPRLNIVHTSRENEGQIYLPAVNQFLALACIALVLGFQQSSRLAAAYGIAVTGTMLITSIVFYFITVHAWRWPLWKAGSGAGPSWRSASRRALSAWTTCSPIWPVAR